MATELRNFPSKWLDWRPRSDCDDFGIGEILAATLPEIFAGAAGPTIGAEALGSALPGAAFGAATSGITGGDPLTGAFTGALTGGAIGGAGGIAGDLGISSTLAQTIAGGGAGLLGSEITGSNPLLGTLGGAGGGLLSGAFSGGSGGGDFGSGTAAGTTAGGPAVASTAASSAAPLTSDSGLPSFSGGGPGFSNPITTDTGATGTGIPTAAGGATGGSSGNWLSDALGTTGGTGTGSKIVDYLGNNPAVLAGGGLLGASMLMGSGSIPGSGALKGNAASLQALGNQELQSLQTGQVPTGAQSLLDHTKNSLNARTRSSYAGLGLSGSTMEAQAMQQNDAYVEGQKWNIISDLVKQGTTSLQGAATINNNLMLQEIARDKDKQNAIARFAAALAGSSGSKAA